MKMQAMNTGKMGGHLKTCSRELCPLKVNPSLKVDLVMAWSLTSMNVLRSYSLCKLVYTQELCDVMYRYVELNSLRHLNSYAKLTYTNRKCLMMRFILPP